MCLSQNLYHFKIGFWYAIFFWSTLPCFHLVTFINLFKYVFIMWMSFIICLKFHLFSLIKFSFNLYLLHLGLYFWLYMIKVWLKKLIQAHCSFAPMMLEIWTFLLIFLLLLFYIDFIYFYCIIKNYIIDKRWNWSN